MRYGFKDIVIDSRTGLNPRKNFVLGRGDNNYITIKDIYDGRINITDKTDKVDDNAIQIIKKRSRIKVGDILFVSIGRIGETAIVTAKDDTWDVNESVFVFTINRKIITPGYFCMLFQSDAIQKYLLGNSSGSTFKSIKMNQLEKMIFELPPLTVQEEIMAKISKVKAICNLRISELTHLDNLIKARFVELFGTYPANERSWPTGTIRELVTEVRYGSSRKAADGNKGKYPYLRMNNITYGGELDLTDTKTIDVPDDELDKCTVRRGDLLFNRTNSKELVGKTCVYNRDETMILAGFVVRVRLNDRALPEFVAAFMNTDFSKQMLLGMCKAAIGQANINAQELQNIGIYIPPVRMQKEFASFKEQVDKSKVAVQKALDEAQLLFDSLMQQYFG